MQHRGKEVLPQSVESGARIAVAVAPQRRESLTRRPSDDDVGVGIRGGVHELDVSVMDVDAEVGFVGGGGCLVVLHREDRVKALSPGAVASQPETQSESARSCKEVDGCIGHGSGPFKVVAEKCEGGDPRAAWRCAEAGVPDPNVGSAVSIPVASEVSDSERR